MDQVSHCASPSHAVNIFKGLFQSTFRKADDFVHKWNVLFLNHQFLDICSIQRHSKGDPRYKDCKEYIPTNIQPIYPKIGAESRQRLQIDTEYS